jgi:hypothetical protein
VHELTFTASALSGQHFMYSRGTLIGVTDIPPSRRIDLQPLGRSIEASRSLRHY